MGCGILFPNDYDSEADSDQSPDDPDVSNRELDLDEYPSDSDSEDENMWWRHGNDEQGTKVQVGLSSLSGFTGRTRVLCVQSFVLSILLC